MAALQKRKMAFLTLAPLAVQAMCSCFLILFVKIGALDPTNKRNKCFEILDAAAASSNYGSYYAPNGHFVHGDLFFS